MPWSNGTSRIFFTTSLGKIAHDSPKGVAVADYFYKIQPLDEVQRSVVRSISVACSPECRELHQELLEPILLTQQLVKHYQMSGISDKKADNMVQAILCNQIEDFHGSIERGMAPILEKLLLEDLDVLNERDKQVPFFEYLGHQFARTQNARKILSGVTSISSTNPMHALFLKTVDDTSWLITLLLGMNMGFNYFIAREKYHFAMLINDSDTPFITSDQPVVNIYPATSSDLTEPPTGSDLYYPISPRLAVVMCESDCFAEGKQFVDSQTAHTLNTHLAQRANVHLVGNSRNALLPYVLLRGTRYQEFVEAFNKKSVSTHA